MAIKKTLQKRLDEKKMRDRIFPSHFEGPNRTEMDQFGQNRIKTARNREFFTLFDKWTWFGRHEDVSSWSATRGARKGPDADGLEKIRELYARLSKASFRVRDNLFILLPKS